ncbi:hypothetical protein JCM8097_003653 [Rhodosporidiobolus ruineniae]
MRPSPGLLTGLRESTGIFNSIRSAAQSGARPGPYSGQLSRPITSSFPSFARAAHSRAAPRARFGPTPRPTVSRSTPHTLGLSSARNFSSSQPLFNNIVYNAPLALRALSGQVEDGIDERKWRKVRRELRERNRTDVKGKGAAKDPLVALKEKKAEFAAYFGGTSSVDVVEEAQPVTLTLAVDPDVELPLSSSSAAEVENRLLTPSLLHSFGAITSAYDHHAHRLRVIVNRLSAAGLLDLEAGATSGFSLDAHGRRTWEVVFRDGLVTRSRVERVIRGQDGVEPLEDEENDPHHLGWDAKVRRWNRSSAGVGSSASAMVLAGEGEWWWLAGGTSAASSPSSSVALSADLDSPIFPPSLLASSYASSDSGASSAFAAMPGVEEVDAAYARAIADAFVLPDPSSASFAADVDDAALLSFAYEEPEAPTPLADADEVEQDWDSWSLRSSPSPASDVYSPSVASLSASTTSFSVAEEVELDPAASVWAEQVELASVSGSASEAEYAEGVRTFLGEVEAERQRREWVM